MKEEADIFKSSFSVSGVVKILMMKKFQKILLFCLYIKRHADLYKKIRSQLTGGLSIVFSRMAVAGITPIRPQQFKELLIAQRVLGIGANSLFLSCVVSTNRKGFSVDAKKRKIIGHTHAQNMVCPATNGLVIWLILNKFLFNANLT